MKSGRRFSVTQGVYPNPTLRCIGMACFDNMGGSHLHLQVSIVRLREPLPKSGLGMIPFQDVNEIKETDLTMTNISSNAKILLRAL